jgi:dGTP triphosphohydrolase
MPPKAKPSDLPENSLEALVETVQKLTASTDALREQLSASAVTINDLSYRLTNIEALLKITQKENTDLKTDLSNSYQEVKSLKTKLNNLEQHHRSWSIRVVGMKIPAAEESDNDAVKNHLYNKLLKPILVGAVQKNMLSKVPPVDEVLERAHILPTKKDGAKPIIARFYCREIRALIFKLKKEFAPKEESGAVTRRQGGDQRMKTRFMYQIFDDLTRANFSKMRAIGDDSRVDQCWAVNGQLRFRLVDSNEIRKVSSIFDSIEDILK